MVMFIYPIQIWIPFHFSFISTGDTQALLLLTMGAEASDGCYSCSTLKKFFCYCQELKC